MTRAEITKIGSNAEMEKHAQKHDEHALPGTPITEKRDNAINRRIEQREALKAYRLTKDPGNAFSIDMGNGSEVKDKRLVGENSKRRLDEISHVDVKQTEADKLAQIEKAADVLLETAAKKWGHEEIDSLHIGKGDLGSSTAALLLGPGVCKSMGSEEARNIGKRYLVFGVAPMLGLVEEANKQFTQFPKGMAHEGSSNLIAGATIGALLEHVNPVVLTAVSVGGLSLFIKDQLSSPEHRARNKEIAAVSSSVDASSNIELLTLLNKTKTLIGPELYRASFTLATGGSGLPEGRAVNIAAREEAQALTKIDAGDGLKLLQNLSHDAWEALQPLLEQPGLKPAFAGGMQDFHIPMSSYRPGENAGSLEGNILQMQSGGVARNNNRLEHINNAIEKLSTKPIAANLESLIETNTELIRLSKFPVTTQDQANALASVEEKFIDHMKIVREEVVQLKPQAEAIQAKSHVSKSEEKLVERFYAAEDSLYGVVTDRLESLYGWKKGASAVRDTGIYNRSGMGTQRQISNMICDILDAGLEKNPEILRVLKANGASAERASGWVGISMPGASGADHAGCDYLLANKNTGEIYTLDVTERASGMKTGHFVETRLTNRDLGFPDKDIPNERKHLVIGVADEVARDNAIFKLTNGPEKLSKNAATDLVDDKEQKQLAEIIAQTISHSSKLNILETPLPAANVTAPASRQAYELQRFGASLEKIGYPDWARSITKSVRYIKSQNSSVPSYD